MVRVGSEATRDRGEGKRRRDDTLLLTDLDFERARTDANGFATTEYRLLDEGTFDERAVARAEVANEHAGVVELERKMTARDRVVGEPKLAAAALADEKPAIGDVLHAKDGAELGPSLFLDTLAP